MSVRRKHGCGSTYRPKECEYVDYRHRQMEKMSKEMVSLIRDDDEVYHRNVYKQYVDALRATGQPADNVPYDGFVQQLTAHANRLKGELGCDRVRFLVEIEGGKSTLKPVPLD